MENYYKCYGDICQCLICPHQCRIGVRSSGICRVRRNEGNGIIALSTYGYISGYGSDPIEKKPLYHFYPGTTILSVGSYGCNLRCDFCQNHSISASYELPQGLKTDPAKIVADALTIRENTGIAFTYNEPVVWFEFMLDIAARAKTAGLKTVMVSNGYINPKPLQELIQVIDAFNIDLKFFNNDSYKEYTGGTLAPVLKCLHEIADSECHLEITTLIIPELNDSKTEMQGLTDWVASECGNETPLHLSRYHPAHKRDTGATPLSKLTELHSVASEKLAYVYTGNAPELKMSDTICPDCGTTVTIRSGYRIKLQNLTQNGNCSKCDKLIYKSFTSPE